MTQLNLLDHERSAISISVDYDGISADLQKHEIDAKSYAISVGGYSRFLHEFIHELSGKTIEVYVISNEEGSFKTVLKIVYNSIVGYSVIASILSFHGVNAGDVERYIISAQEKIVNLIADSAGSTEKILNKITNDESLSEELKKILKKIITNTKARKGLDDFTRPLERSGYEKIKVSTREDCSYVIYDSQREAFKYTPPDIVVEEPFRETVRLLYLSPVFTEWKFQGAKDFWAEVQDFEFLDRTKNRLFSELQGKFYLVSGTAKTVRKEGARKGTTTWIINKVSELQEIHTLL